VPTATEIRCPAGVISPGLINAHDHITYTQNWPHIDTGERYEHRHEWRIGLDGHTKIPAPGGASADQIRWGELRFLMGGATATVSSGGASGWLRNLDSAAKEEGLAEPAVDFDTFPLGDSTPPAGFPAAVACSAFTTARNASDVAAVDSYEPHIAEGIDEYAGNEFVCTSSANPGHDLILSQTAVIHGIGLHAVDYALMAARGAKLVWSPRSNVSLYGATADVTLASRLGITVALGSDWIVSGSMNLLRELRCADQWNAERLGGYFGDEDLWLQVTRNAAQVTATDDRIGVLTPGRFADIAIFDGAVHHQHRAVIDADPQDVVLVMRAGTVLYGDAQLVDALASGCDAIDVCGISKSVCAANEIGETLPQVTAAAGAIYPAFFCGEPSDEPTCVPSRPASIDGSTMYDGAITASDADGDGIPDASDLCPTVFDPIRPLDRGAQPDADGDGLGDACDPCPFGATCVPEASAAASGAIAIGALGLRRRARSLRG
jgi:hypothetical protein